MESEKSKNQNQDNSIFKYLKEDIAKDYNFLNSKNQDYSKILDLSSFLDELNQTFKPKQNYTKLEELNIKEKYVIKNLKSKN